MKNEKQRIESLLEKDAWLEEFRSDLELRVERYTEKRAELVGASDSLVDFSNAHQYYGFHRTEDGWVYREWAPAAESLFLVGDFNNWAPRSHPLARLENGDWEIHLGPEALRHRSRLKVIVRFDGQDHYKIPLFMNYVIQEVHDDGSNDFIGELWAPETPYVWQHAYTPKKNVEPLIYEAHVGMALEEARVGTYREFADQILPRIAKSGYNAVQLMAIMQHPYYGSFGYHVSNFYAPSSWFGTPDDLRYLIDQAHGYGLSVYMDLVHSHAVKNTVEGINRFDGSQSQFFLPDERGLHNYWDSMCFDYGKNEVLHFLLSNLKYWKEEFHFDGFRFDGITSMLYWDHGMGTDFDNYEKYFSLNTNIDAITYLTLASELLHTMDPQTVLIAEDMSGLPGLCLPIESAGVGFDYRLAMGVPDLWIRLMKKSDYDWDMHHIYYELTTARPGEKRIAYAESHDQALVGDKTLFFWLTGPDIYWHMQKNDPHFNIDRAIALHKMIRLVTISTGADGYLNFIGNEFGHPEWVDFPSAENGWSFHYCRRQWSLVDNPDLKYEYLAAFDRDMLAFVKKGHLLGSPGTQLLWVDQQRKILAYRKNNYIFLYNFHPIDSYESFSLPIHQEGYYRVVFSTDRKEYGGFSRIPENLYYESHPLIGADYSNGVQIYIPARTVLVLRRASKQEEKESAQIREEKAAHSSEQQAVEQLLHAEALAQAALGNRKVPV